MLNLPLHQQRLDRARHLLLGLKDNLPLDSIVIPRHAEKGTFKCRITYGKSFGTVEFIAYHPVAVETLQAVNAGHIDYAFKFSDRTPIEKLRQQKGLCDDILMVKDGWVTDTSFANILFFDGSRWVTPHRPLLKGTKREELLKTGRVTALPIRLEDIGGYKKFMLVNAMLEFDPAKALPVNNIIVSGVSTNA